MLAKKIIEKVVLKRAFGMADEGRWHYVIYFYREANGELKSWTNENVFKSDRNIMPPIEKAIAKVEAEVEKRLGKSRGSVRYHFKDFSITAKRWVCSYNAMLTKANIDEKEILGLVTSPLEYIQARRNAD